MKFEIVIAETPDHAVELMMPASGSFIQNDASTESLHRDCRGWDGRDTYCQCGAVEYCWEIEQTETGYVAVPTVI